MKNINIASNKRIMKEKRKKKERKIKVSYNDFMKKKLYLEYYFIYPE